MLRKLYDLMNRPFPLVETHREKFSLSLTIGIFVFAFLTVFQPFGLNELQEFKYLYLVGYGVVSFFVELFFTFGLMIFFSKFYDPQNWTLGKHIINVFFFIISLAFFNWLYTIWIDYPNYSPFLPFLIDTLSIGFFPSIFIFFYLERKLRLKNIGLSKRINNTFLNTSNTTKGKNNKEEFPLLKIEGKNIIPEKILCIKSLGNYVTLCYIENNEIKKETIRTTMKQIENNLEGNNDIVRCHKSYFINLKKVTNSFGNARSLYFQIEGVNMQIPVSRKVAKKLFAKVA